MADFGIPGFIFQPDVKQHQHGGRKPAPITINTKEIVDGGPNTASSDLQWQPGVRARFPWIGFGALSLMLFCIASTIAILETSNGKAQEEWPGKRPVY
jgi:hypothetical protein